MNMYIRNNQGFSLLELLISMLIVAVALLGFASLQAYSSRTINANMSKNIGSSVVKEVSKTLQMGVGDLKQLPNDNNWNALNITCGGDNVVIFNQPAIVNQIPVFANNIRSLCSKVIGAQPGIRRANLEIDIIRNFPLGSDQPVRLRTFNAQVRYAYVPLSNRRGNVNVADVGSVELEDSVDLMDYCFADNEEGNANKKANVVCNEIEVDL
ncbi:MAG: prepilin-type N-terminal cleavage/methylation domain-containing protein [Succinivibrionaceae bacterium]